MSKPANSHGTVTSLAGRAGYRADYRGLASAQVRAAREKLRMDHDAFADYLSGAVGWEIFPGVIGRWEAGGGTPPGDVVLAVAATVQDMSAAAAALHHDGSEEVTPYADRGLIGREQWNAVIRGAARHVWLYGMAEHGYADDDEVPGLMADAAGRGCEIRVLLLDPGYPGIGDIDEAEGNPPGTLAARIRSSEVRFAGMRGRCGGRMEVRAYGTHPTVSVVRGDDGMLITPYLRFSAGNNSPTLGIAAGSAPRMWGRYARHFASMWDLAREAA